MQAILLTSFPQSSHRKKDLSVDFHEFLSIVQVSKKSITKKIKRIIMKRIIYSLLFGAALCTIGIGCTKDNDKYNNNGNGNTTINYPPNPTPVPTVTPTPTADTFLNVKGTVGTETIYNNKQYGISDADNICISWDPLPSGYTQVEVDFFLYSSTGASLGSFTDYPSTNSYTYNICKICSAGHTISHADYSLLQIVVVPEKGSGKVKAQYNVYVKHT